MKCSSGITPLIALSMSILASEAKAHTDSTKTIGTLPNAHFSVPKPLSDSCDNPLRVTFLGDFFVNSKNFEKINLEGAKDILSWGHFNVANFEGNTVDPKKTSRAFPDFPFALAMDLNAPSILSKAGILYATRANNHAMDFGPEGMRQTSAALQQEKIKWAGVGENIVEAAKPMSLEHNGTKVAVFSFASTWPEESWATTERPGIAYPTVQRLITAIREAKATHDFIVVAFHWGGELTTELRPYQHGLVQATFDAGADVIYGHHAHMAQGIELRDKKPLAWGLGNFLFSSIGKEKNMSFAMHAEFCKANDKNSVHTAYTAIETGSILAQTGVFPMSQSRFLQYVGRYQKENILSPHTLFFIPSEGKTLTLEEWKKESQQGNAGQTLKKNSLGG